MCDKVQFHFIRVSMSCTKRLSLLSKDLGPEMETWQPRPGNGKEGPREPPGPAGGLEPISSTGTAG
jgi:hypothetical protein